MLTASAEGAAAVKGSFLSVDGSCEVGALQQAGGRYHPTQLGFIQTTRVSHPACGDIDSAQLQAL